jgi:hypothetical protein
MYTLAHHAGSALQFDSSSPPAAAGGLGAGDAPSLLAACQDLCDPHAGVVTDLAYFGCSCWVVSAAAVQHPVANSNGRNVSSWQRHTAPAPADSAVNEVAWWLAPPTLHVFQDALPTAARFCRAVRQPSVSIAAARGELESFQLVLRSPISARRARVSLSSAPSAGGLSLSWR